jgi:HK97 gp10 family phage protein
MSSGVKLIGERELTKLLNSLGDRVARKALRQAVNAAASPVVKVAKQKAKKQSGLLKKSLGKKVVTNKKSQSATAVVGARKSVQGTYKGKPRKPSRYVHLVEKPHIGPGGNYVPGQPFLGPAADETREQSKGIMAGKLREVIEREAAKGGRK